MSAIDLSGHKGFKEDIIETAGHLDLIRDLVRKHITSSERKRDFEVRVDFIETRSRNRRLNLAVIGEFSSGKSTFINALLRQRLLKASCVATTASATYIEPGPEFSINTMFSNEIQVKSTNTSYANLQESLEKIKPNLNNKITLRELLDLLTSDHVVADTVKRIDITIPSDQLSQDIVIIDTPGINAGACDTENHAQVTKNVLEQDADSAVILIPSFSAITDTLINFLLQNAKPFLHRCVFVLTAMDQLNSNDRLELVKMVKLQIGEKLNLPNAMVFESSAITMIPVKEVPTFMMTEEAWSYWQNQFVLVEAEVKQVMLRQRGLIITERLVRLIQELFSELSDDLNKKKTMLDQEKKLLRENSVAAIEEVMKALLVQSNTKIMRQQQAIKSHISTKESIYRSAAKSDIDEIINNAGWQINSYEEIIVPQIREIVEDQGAYYVKNTNKELKKLRDCCKSVSVEFVQQFELNYKAFPSLGVDLAMPLIDMSSISMPEMSFSTSRSYVEQQNKNDDEGGGIGTVLGAIGGFFIGGPVGAVIGAGLGRVGGRGAAGDSLEERQKTLRSYADSDNKEFFKKYRKKLSRQLDSITENILRQLQNAANAHVEEYGVKVDQLLKKHAAEEERLIREINEILADSQNLSHRKVYLENLKQQLLQV